MPECRVCHAPSSESATFDAPESMFGTGQSFPYFRCERCGGLQIETLPDVETLTQAYDSDRYYSGASDVTWPWTMPVHRIMKIDAGPAMAYLAGTASREQMAELAETVLKYYLTGFTVRQDMRILDVGCGDGGFVRALSDAGYESVAGLDPFATSQEDAQAPVFNCALEDLDEDPYDIICFHHSFEHVADPIGTLQAARARVRDGGRVLLRMPRADTPGFAEYGPHWAFLDAPRHLFIHTTESLRHCCKQAGFRLRTTVSDSTGFQYWGSEQIKQGVHFWHERSLVRGVKPPVIGIDDLYTYETLAQERNSEGNGDQAGFVLAPKR